MFPQALFRAQRHVQARQRLCHDMIVGRERTGRQAIVPDLAEVVAFPLDHLEGGLGGGRRKKAGSSNDTGGGTKDQITALFFVPFIGSIVRR